MSFMFLVLLLIWSVSLNYALLVIPFVNSIRIIFLSRIKLQRKLFFNANLKMACTSSPQDLFKQVLHKMHPKLPVLLCLLLRIWIVCLIFGTHALVILLLMSWSKCLRLVMPFTVVLKTMMFVVLVNMQRAIDYHFLYVISKLLAPLL